MPRGRPAKVDHVRETFLSEVDRALALVDAITTLPVKVTPSNNPGLHPKYKNQVRGLAFMGLIASWEEFLERTMVRYVTGSRTNSGYVPTLKAGKANSIDHAYELLSMDPNYEPNKSYLKVTDTRWVRRVADFYFSAHPYGCLQNKTDLLRHASNIRNRVAHDSTKCKADFKKTAIYFLQPGNGQLPQGYAPGQLLSAPVQRHFGQLAINQEQTHLRAYADLFRDLSRQIVP